jgi:predicted DNA-binding transcriptional regulator YafY
MTAKELAEHFEVSVRTILRDIETLSMADIPIYTVQGKGGGVRLIDNFVLNKSVLTDKEQQDILSALQGLNTVEVPEVEKVLSKLGALFNKNATSWIDIDFSPWGSNASEKDKFSILRDAILSKKMIQFDYFSYYGERVGAYVSHSRSSLRKKHGIFRHFAKKKRTIVHLSSAE